jgi:hypothetical protein
MLTHAQRMPTHKAKMARKKNERLHARPTRLEEAVAREKAAGIFKSGSMNISRHPKGVKRTRAPVYS